MPNQNVWFMLKQSRKFWVFTISTLSALILYFSAKYLAPSQADDVKYVVGALMAFAGWYLKMMKDEDVARLQNPPIVQTTTTGTGSIVSPLKVTTTASGESPGISIATNPSTHIGG